MYNIEMDYFMSSARIAKEALNNMSLIWEQMQFNGTEPSCLNMPSDYPFNKSFDEVVAEFSYWVDSLE